MPALSNFLNDELARRGWTIPEFAERAGPGLSQSNAYLIVRDGKDNVRQDTFDLIAAALDLSPADLMVLIGKGPTGADPTEAVVAALFRQVPTDQRPAATSMLRGLVGAIPQRSTNGRRDAIANRRPGETADHAGSHRQRGDTSTGGALPKPLRHVGHQAFPNRTQHGPALTAR